VSCPSRRPGALRSRVLAAATTLASVCLLATAARAEGLTTIELRWVKGAGPVLAWARQSALPLDVVVQPQDAPGEAPLAMAFVEGRCKLVLSMRGNPEAQATLDRLPADLREAGIEMMAAHELAHCHRHVDGAWAQVPAGVPLEAIPAVLDAEDRTAWLDMKATRREEGYADLVGLAWTREHHAGAYARLHAWLEAERRRDRLPGSHHDTVAWVDLAPAGTEFAAGELFDRTMPLWAEGIARPE